MKKNISVQAVASGTDEDSRGLPNAADIQRLLDLSEVMGGAEPASVAMGWSKFKAKKWVRIAKRLGMDGTWDHELFLKVRDRSGVGNMDLLAKLSADHMASLVDVSVGGGDLPEDVEVAVAGVIEQERLRKTRNAGCLHAVPLVAAPEPANDDSEDDAEELTEEQMIEREIADLEAVAAAAARSNDWEAVKRASSKISKKQGRLKAIRDENGSHEVVRALREQLICHIEAKEWNEAKAVSAKLEAIESGRAVPKPLKGGAPSSKAMKRFPKSVRRFIITTAQNNSYLHDGFLKALENYAKHNDAQLVVIPISYNIKAWENMGGNTKSGQKQGIPTAKYDERVRPYLIEGDYQLADDLYLLGRADRNPTAANPLSGVVKHTRGGSGIFPHTKQVMESVPRKKDRPFRHMWTTGACTHPNYIQREAGFKAELDHKYGAVVVELNAKGQWVARNVEATSDGVFQDLSTVYGPEGIRLGVGIDTLVMGDIHRFYADETVNKATLFGKRSIYRTLLPARIILHDVLHMKGRSHYGLKDHYMRTAAYFFGFDRVEAEIDGDAAFLKAIEDNSRKHGRGRTEKVGIVDANHNGAFGTWLANPEAGLTDAPNARYWCEHNYKRLAAVEKGVQDYNPYEAAIREKAALPLTEFFVEDRTTTVCDDCEDGPIDISMHGHLGNNGAKGSPQSFTVLGIRAVTGHTHSPGIRGDIYTVGVSGSLDQGYNKGQTSWSHTHALIYPNGKVALVTLRGEDFHYARHDPFVADDADYEIAA